MNIGKQAAQETQGTTSSLYVGPYKFFTGQVDQSHVMQLASVYGSANIESEALIKAFCNRYNVRLPTNAIDICVNQR